MKKIYKILVISTVLLSASFKMVAQDDNYDSGFKLGFGLNGGLPLSDPFEYNLGADIRLQYDFSETYSLTFTTGYNNLFGKDNASDLSYVPVKIGYKTFLFKNEFYVMGEIGGAFAITNDYGGDNSMLFCPSIGYATKYIDISLRYEFLKDFPIIKDNQLDDGLAQVMIRLAYGFDL